MDIANALTQMWQGDDTTAKVFADWIQDDPQRINEVVKYLVPTMRQPDPDVAQELAAVQVFVEASDHEVRDLWFHFAECNRDNGDNYWVAWDKMAYTSWFVPVVHFLGGSISLAVTIYTISGAPVAFWHTTSALVVRNAVDRWFNCYFPKVPRTNSVGFYIVAEVINSRRMG